VARCMPGVEAVEVLDEDNVSVRATQSIGPMTATFDAKVTVLERVPTEFIRFQAIGRSVRGAIGNVRTMNEVHIQASDAGTTIAVDGDVVLAGPLGSVGQKIVARQAGKVTAEFADNLRLALTGAAPPELGPAREPRRPVAAGRDLVPAGQGEAARPDPWSRVAAGLSAVSVVVSVIALIRSWRGRR
jgi:carbon monoxide dehydrogenase subunit G